jgi:hypothetical protein
MSSPQNNPRIKIGLYADRPPAGGIPVGMFYVSTDQPIISVVIAPGIWEDFFSSNAMTPLANFAGAGVFVVDPAVRLQIFSGAGVVTANLPPLASLPVSRSSTFVNINPGLLTVNMTPVIGEKINNVLGPYVLTSSAMFTATSPYWIRS